VSLRLLDLGLGKMEKIARARRSEEEVGRVVNLLSTMMDGGIL
jgi:hypothetical protein